jgi:tetratricopeptide (TPR) repeat protein
MSEVNENKKIDIDITIKEAEVYRSQGLLAESLKIYEKILSVSPEIDDEIEKIIYEKIDLLKEEIDEFEQDDPVLSDQDISALKETWSAEETVEAILNSASSFKELGLLKETIEEYKKLI